MLPKATMKSTYRRSSVKGVAFLLAVIALAAGIYVWQRQYINKHLPLIKAGMAQADAEGELLMTGFGSPPGVTFLSAIEKRIGKGGPDSGFWDDVPYKITWTWTGDAPGNQDNLRAWYEKRLLADDWKVFHQRITSTLKTEYWKDKWLLTLEQLATFPSDQPPHVRFKLRLTWDYWHELQSTSAAYAIPHDTDKSQP
jgi:hypothetical protein